MRIAKIEQLMGQRMIAPKLRAKIQVLLQSITDWPVDVETTEMFMQELTTCIRGEITEASVKKRLSNIDYASEAWIAESLEVLMDIFQGFAEGTALSQIIASLEAELSKVS
jgi:hypothetical protein